MQIAVRITLAALSPEPLYTGGPFVSGVAKLGTANPPVGGWGWGPEYFVSCGAFGERVDIVTGGNYGQLLDTEMSLSNHDKWFAPFTSAGASLVGAKVEIGEAISADDMLLSWVGVVADPTFQGMNIEMRVENILATRHKMIPARTLTSQEFPGLISDIEGKPVPSIYGSVGRLSSPSLQFNSDSYYASFIWGDAKVYMNVPSTSGISFGASEAVVITTTTIGWTTLSPSWIIAVYMTMNDFWINQYTYGNDKSKNVYVRISGGQGQGQVRLISSISDIALFRTGAGNTYATAKIITSTPWDTVPDNTSSFEFFNRDTWGQVLAGDECEISSISYEIGNKNFPIAFEQTSNTGIVFGDLSAEFVNGEDYAALSYVKPSEVYGVTALSDGITTGETGRTVSAVPWAGGGGDNCGDVICRAKMTFNQVPDFNGEEPELYALFSFKELDYYPAQKMRLIWRARYFDHTAVIPDDESSDSEYISGDAIIDFNAYTPACSIDGTKGNFSAFAVKLDLPRSIYSYESVRIGVMPVLDFTVEATLNTPPASPVTTLPYLVGSSPTGAFSAHAGEFAYWSGSAWAFYAVPDTSLTIVPNAIYTVGDPLHISIPPGYGGDLTGKYIKLTLSLSTNDPRGKSFYYKDRFLKIDEGLKSSFEDWRKIISWHHDSGTGRNIVTLETPLDSSFIYGSFRALIATSDKFRRYIEREAGFAFLYGSIPADSTYLLDLSSGRTYSDAWPELPICVSNGDPIILARDAVLDMYYRDLGLGADSVDFASFQALRSDRITSALVERVNSADRVATLCQQFNWVVGHDKTGRETATAWLLRIGSTEYDLSIDTSDVVEGSLTGVSMTDILDLVNNPNVKWNWTQADGYRSSSNVSDVSADPLILNAGNYLQYLTGFGDFSSSLDVYTAFHASYKLNTYQKSAVFELPDVGEDASRVLWPGRGMNRFDWMASRKPLYSLVVPDTSAAASCVVGQRVRLRHKRYTAGLWVYGTIVEWSMDPMAAERSIIVMGDPVPLTSGTNLIVDTIDPTGSVPTWEDQVDGISDEKNDSIGVA